MNKSPCLNCNKRKINCHSECTDYIVYHLYIQNRNQVIHKNKMKDTDFKDFKTTIINKERRNR